MQVTLKPDSQTVTQLWSIITLRNSQYARVTRLSPVFRVRVATRDYPNHWASSSGVKCWLNTRPVLTAVVEKEAAVLRC